MKKQKMSLKELYSLAKGKPVNCCTTNGSANGQKNKEVSDQCCSGKKEDSCC